MNSETFNRRTARARISASWPHDSSHYRFERQHKSLVPFTESKTATRLADVIFCVGAVIVFAAILGGFGWLL